MILRGASGPPEIEGYEITQRLGRSGLGSSFLCNSRVTSDASVIKVIRSPLHSSARLLEVFREALANLSDMSHPGIVEVQDFGISSFAENGWGICLKMEWCAKGNAQQAAENAGGRLPAHEVFDIIETSLQGLAFAHSLKVIHGNIKPSNLLIVKNGTNKWGGKIGDFTLRRILQQVLLTKAEAECYYLDNINFLPPEQRIDTGHMTSSGDVWSLGATYYHLLTGSSPYSLARPKSLAEAAIAGNFTPIRSHYPTAPPGLEGLFAIIEKALNPLPTERYPSAVEMWQDFQRVPRPSVVVVAPRRQNGH
jgi:serine/threonine-protein kinase